MIGTLGTESSCKDLHEGLLDIGTGENWHGVCQAECQELGRRLVAVECDTRYIGRRGRSCRPNSRT